MKRNCKDGYDQSCREALEMAKRYGHHAESNFAYHFPSMARKFLRT